MASPYVLTHLTDSRDFYFYTQHTHLLRVDYATAPELAPSLFSDVAAVLTGAAFIDKGPAQLRLYCAACQFTRPTNGPATALLKWSICLLFCSPRQNQLPTLFVFSLPLWNSTPDFWSASRLQRRHCFQEHTHRVDLRLDG